MPRKRTLEKQTITLKVGGNPLNVTLHPPTRTRKSWYAYWTGLVTSKSTGHWNLDDAIVAAEFMLRNDGKRTTLGDSILSDLEFEEIQRAHYAKRKGAAEQSRSAKSLVNCLEAIRAFKVISGLSPISVAGPDQCAAFQRKCLTLPKTTLRPFPKSDKEAPSYSANTVVKWSVALQAAWERSVRTAGKKCVRGIVNENKLLAQNPWRQFTWIEGYDRPIRQFDAEELLGLLDYLDQKWAAVTVASLLAKVLLWSCARRAEVSSLTWQQLRVVGPECHFKVIGKWGVKRWFRLPELIHQELLAIRTDSPFVFAAYNDQLRRFYKRSSRPRAAKAVGLEFNPVCLGDWFHERLDGWSSTLQKGHAYTHVFRKTSLQYARRGEDASRRVAQDAGVSENVLMKHYVEESDPELREASNRTFKRVSASLPTEVACRYGYMEVVATELENRLQSALKSGNWAQVANLAAQLANRPHVTIG